MDGSHFFSLVFYVVRCSILLFAVSDLPLTRSVPLPPIHLGSQGALRILRQLLLLRLMSARMLLRHTRHPAVALILNKLLLSGVILMLISSGSNSLVDLLLITHRSNLRLQSLSSATCRFTLPH